MRRPIPHAPFSVVASKLIIILLLKILKIIKRLKVYVHLHTKTLVLDAQNNTLHNDINKDNNNNN